MYIISSLANPHVRQVQELHTARGRKKYGRFIMEGPHLLAALLDADIVPHEVYYQPELLQRTAGGSALLERLTHTPALASQQLITVSERVSAALGDVQTSQGVVSVVSLDAFTSAQVRKRRPSIPRPALLVLDALADPGNMGTLLRTALAADVEAVLLTPDCVDVYNPKVVRAAAGAHIALPIETCSDWNSIATRAEEHAPGRVLLAEAGSSHIYYDQDLVQPFVLIIGNEAHGPSPAARALATLTITIPLANGVESLNAAMAAGIILYESVRQRKV